METAIIIKQQKKEKMKIINRFKLAISYLLKFSKVWGMPIEASIEITSRCNLNCIMCPRKAINRPIKDMDYSLFKKAINQLAPSVELVYLHGLGEPLLNKNLFKMIGYAKKKGLRVGISTNAIVLDKRKSKELLKSGIDYIIFALDAASKKTYQKIRRGGNFEKATGNTRYFLNQKKKLRLPIFCVVQMIIMPENKKEKKKFLEMWRASGANVVRIKPVVDFFHKKKKAFLQGCFYPYRMVNIYFDGTIVPCCQDNFGQYSLGNIKKESLRDIWNGKKAQFLRKKLAQNRRKDINICQRCSYPQPSILGTLGLAVFSNLTVKKILPILEKLPFFRNNFLIYE